MLAFDKDIKQDQPKHPQEDKNQELKQYMDYQRQLNHERIIYHSLDYAKSRLQEKIQEVMAVQKALNEYLQKEFFLSSRFAEADTLMLMLRKMINAHNATNSWYKMNPYYLALAYDSIKSFVIFYNRALRESPEEAADCKVSEEMAIDFDDWVQLFFPNLDFHIGRELKDNQYPYVKRVNDIEGAIEKKIKDGSSREKALKDLQEEYSIEDSTIQFLLSDKTGEKDLELFYTSVENPIYEYLFEKQDGSWGTLDGETLIDQAYGLGAHLKMWEWGKQDA